MHESNPKVGSRVEVQIAFPKSSEDHRLQLVEVNGSIFAIVHAPLESEGPIRLECQDWSLVLLGPIKSKTNIFISAINVICLNEIASEEGIVNIHASNRLVQFAEMIKSPEKICEIGECGEFFFDEDPSAFLFYHRLFENLMHTIAMNNFDAFSEAQQRVLMGLCGLAQKIHGKVGNLSLQSVLSLWKIPPIKR